MNSRHYPVLIVGGGQAGLSVSYYLTQAGIGHVVLEKSRTFESWRSERWDAFHLVTPNWQCRLPGHAYDGDEPEGFMNREQIVQYLERFQHKFDPPVRTGVEVDSVRKNPLLGWFEIATSEGEYTADQVVIAVGCFHRPRLPGGAHTLPSNILQLHPSEYRNAHALPQGAVLVAGSGQSGCQIAEDLHLAGRKVHLCLGDAPRSPRQYRGKDVVGWLDMFGYYDTPIDAHPDVDMVRNKTNHYLTGRDGGREIDLRRFALEGMQLYGYLTDVTSQGFRFAPDVVERLDAADEVYLGIRRLIDNYIEKNGIEAPPAEPYVPCYRPEPKTFLDVEAEGVNTVIWCLGYQADFSFVKAPVFDARGYPRYERGVTAERGLYFIGLSWLYTWGSARLSGVARDAEYIGDRIALQQAQGRGTSHSSIQAAGQLGAKRLTA
jgi:putative flavoprotein involved in K+ transport